MASEAVVLFCRRFAHLVGSPVLEVGSKWQPTYSQRSPREITPDLQGEWLGIDIEPGKGVDRVLDLTREDAVLELGEGRFRAIHCHSVLAHVPDVIQFCRHMERLLEPGGWLFVSVPFAWRVSRIPVDLWRFTPQSLDYLFPHIELSEERSSIVTRHPTRVFSLNEGFPELHLGSRLKEAGLPLSLMVRVMRKLGLDGGVFRQRALLVESILVMIGQRMESPTYRFITEDYALGGSSSESQPPHRSQTKA